MLAAIRIRGVTGIKRDIVKTLSDLRLFRKNYCVFLVDSPTTRGMLDKVKDYITWGEVDDSVVSATTKARGEEPDKNSAYFEKAFTFGSKKYKPFFRLNNPKGGFERMGIKKSFKEGGVLGYRGSAVAKLIERML